MVRYDKPLGIPLIAYFLWLLAFVIIAVGTYGFFYGDKFWHDGLLQGLESEGLKLSIAIVFSVFLIICGIGLLKSSSQVRWILIIVCIVGGIHGVIVALEETLRGLLILLTCIIIVVYMFTPRVSAVFQTIDSRKAVDAIKALESYRKRKF